MLRKGNSGSNTAADHIAVLKAAFARLPGRKPGRRPRKIGAGPRRRRRSHPRAAVLAERAVVQYSLGFRLPDTFTAELTMLDKAGLWQPAYDGGGQVRDGAFVAEATCLLNLGSWPEGIRVVVRKERPHPGAAADH